MEMEVDSSDDDVTGGPPSITSLQQLKGLGSVPDLDSKLETASKLCNHGYRAEMILKWLLREIQNSADARSNCKTWDLFGRCLRLIPPQRIGPQLARFDLSSVILQALQVPSQPQQHKNEGSDSLTSAIGTFLDVIFEISRQPTRSAVRAIVTFEAPKAALLLGAWVRRLLQSSQSNKETTGQLLGPAFHIWDSRRSSSVDNELFAEHCLEPLTAMLGYQDVITVAEISVKRKLCSNEAEERYSNHLAHIERLLARHVFLTARKDFTSHQTSDPSENNRLAVALEPIRKSIASGHDKRDQLCVAMPRLLDVALRCITLSTTRQRGKERPWVEHIFQHLMSCLEVNGKLVRPQSVWTMLEIITKRAALSSKFLKELVQRHSGLVTRSSANGVDFEMIARIVAVDANVFVDDTLTAKLFVALTEKSIHKTQITDHDRKLLVEGIAIPVVKAFATNRRLDDFIKLWSDQLQSADQRARWTVWYEINDTIAELLEGHLTADQIEGLLEPFNLNNKGIKDSSSASSAVILHAILTGIKSDELRDKLYLRAGMVFESCFDLLKHDSNSAQANHRHFWLLLSTAFQLWFPRWAANQKNTSNISAKAQSQLSSPVVDSVIASISKSSAPSVSECPSAIEAAESFLGQLLAHLSAYEGCQQYASRIAQLLCDKSTQVTSPAFVSYPELLSLLPDSRQELLSQALHRSAKASMKDALQSRTSLRTIVDYAMGSEDAQLKDQLITALVQYPSKKSQAKDLSSFVDIVLGCLLYVEPVRLTRTQRQTILDHLSAADGIILRHCDHAKHLAVLVKFMEVPNPAANICNDASALWLVARSPSRDESGPRDASTLALLQELTRLLLSHLLPTQDQPRSLKALQSLYKTHIEQVKSITKSKASDDLGTLVVAKIIAQMLEPIRVKLGADDVEREHLTRFTEFLMKQSKKLWKHHNKGTNDEAADMKLSTVLDVLDTYATLGVADEGAVEELARDVADDAGKQREAPKAAVQACKILARLSDTHTLEDARLLLATRSTSAPDTENVLAHISNASKADQVAFFREALPVDADASSESMLVLHRGLMSITKDTFAADDQRTGHALVHRLLAILHCPTDFPARTGAMSCLLTVVRDKPFLVNQHLAESSLTTISELASLTSLASSPLYLELCALLTALLTHHRARLQNRFHLLTAVLQTLLARLFTPNKPLDTSTGRRKALTTRHARAYTRLLTLLCNPPTHYHHSKRSDSAASELVDSARRARAHVGQYAPYLLHSFCSQILTGTLGEGMREVLTPGLWALVESMEVRSPDAVKALSSAMNNSERAVLRGVYDEWRRFGKWDGA